MDQVEILWSRPLKNLKWSVCVCVCVCVCVYLIQKESETITILNTFDFYFIYYSTYTIQMLLWHRLILEFRLSQALFSR